MNLKITILTENVAGDKLLAEHGLSYLVEIDNEKILFDTGHSDVFIKNAQYLGIDIAKEINKVVLSHGHWDHGDGLRFIDNKTLITHPAAFSKRYRKKDQSFVGLALSKNEAETRFRLIETSEPFQITNHLFFLGEIVKTNQFGIQNTDFVYEDGSDDFIPDDTALAAIINDEIVVITGCAHSGICNICEQAKRVTGLSKLKTIIGGFHLKQKNRMTLEAIDYFRQNKVENIFPAHCTGLPAMVAFYNEFRNDQVKTGMILEF